MIVDREFLIKNFGDLWPVHNRGFTALLTECRKLFDGDMEQLLILSAIGERTLTEPRARGRTYNEFMSGSRLAGKPGRINTQSIADSTGIPRETCRRKLKALIDRGWVEKDSDGMVMVTESAAIELASATQATFDYLLDISNIIIELAAKDAAAGNQERR